MKKPAKPPGGRKRHLSEEDEEVWSHTARTLQPLKKAKSRVHTATESLEPAHTSSSSGRVHEPMHASKTAPGRIASLRTTEAAEQQRPAPGKSPPLNDFDKRKARKLGAGQIAIDARIDLHGMRQNEAHVALRRFLFSVYSQGHRWVLVITGKGMRQNRHRDEEPWNIAAVEPGVLRRNVPVWLGEPDVRAIVVSFKTAAVRHGGEGALYVHLRNPDRAGR